MTQKQNNLAWIEQELTQLREAGLLANIRTIESAMDSWVTIGGRRLLNFCANNYLGLANHPRLRGAAKRAIDRYGIRACRNADVSADAGFDARKTRADCAAPCLVH